MNDPDVLFGNLLVWDDEKQEWIKLVDFTDLETAVDYIYGEENERVPE